MFIRYVLSIKSRDIGTLKHLEIKNLIFRVFFFRKAVHKPLFLHNFRAVMIGLHYVPGSHGSHGSQKRSSPWCFYIFCLCVQVLLSLATFSHGLSRSAVTEARRRATVCHGWFYVSSRPATFCWDLSRFVTLRSSSATSIKFSQGFLR